MLKTFNNWKYSNSDIPLAKGSDIRGYIIERVIHRGGMSWVYKARDNRGIAVIIKEFFPGSSAYRNSDGLIIAQPGKEEYYKEAYRRFHEEGRFLGMFRGPNFPRARTFFRYLNTAYIVMEIERGRDLASYIKIDRTEIPWDRAYPFIRDIYHAIKKMHSYNILHLDIHPANIFLNLNGRAQLLDYGAARHFAEPVINSSRFYTPGFSAPEIKMGTRWGFWSDIYSFGSCLKATGVFKNNQWPNEIKELTLMCMKDDLNERISSIDDARFSILN